MPPNIVAISHALNAKGFRAFPAPQRSTTEPRKQSPGFSGL